MELQLGLALPSGPTGLDLNGRGCDSRETLRSTTFTRPLLQLGPGLSTCSHVKSGKRRFGETFEEENARDVPTTLSLLLWNNQPNDGDDPEAPQEDSSSTTDKNDEGVVGWPPVKVWRRRLRQQSHGGGVESTAGSGCRCGARVVNSRYVKVKTEGMAIARKIDLSRHLSFETLSATLLNMFDIPERNSNGYKLVFQDIDGDWLLAQDVPWRRFVGSAQRLKLMRRRS